MPLVSIIVPTYNVENYLKECLDSIINQTLKDIEIICVNDGSTDNSGKILDEYAACDNRIKVIHKENGGYGKAMNMGIENATGEYIGIVEPDDYVLENMYEELYNIAKSNNLDFIKSDFQIFTGSAENRQIELSKLHKKDKYYNKVLKPIDNPETFNFLMNTWTGIYKKDFLEKYNIKHNETLGASYQDNGFWFQTFSFAQNAYFLNKPFYMYRRDNPNSSVFKKSKALVMKEEYDYIRKVLRKYPEIDKKVAPIYQHARFNAYMFNFDRIDNSLKDDFLILFTEDYKKAQQDNEIDKSLYTKFELKNLNLVLNNPKKFYEKSILKTQPHKIINICGIKFKFKAK